MDKRAAPATLMTKGLIGICLLVGIPAMPVSAGEPESVRTQTVLLSHDAAGQVLDGSLENLQNRLGTGGIRVRFSTFHGVVEAPCQKILPTPGGLECRVDLPCHTPNSSIDTDHIHKGYVRTNGYSSVMLLVRRPGASAVLQGIDTRQSMVDWLAVDTQLAQLPPHQ